MPQWSRFDFQTYSCTNERMLIRIRPLNTLTFTSTAAFRIQVSVNSLSFYLKIKTQFCKSSVEPMGEESDHVQIIALSDALGVPIRVVYLDRSSCENNSINVNHHDFVPTSDDMGNSGDPSITLLYRPGHYDILYPK